MDTGRPVLTGIYKDFLAGQEVEVWPSRGTNAVPIAFNPNTGLVYVNTWNVPRIQKLAAQNPQTPGSVSTGVVARNPVIKPGEVVGNFAAINPLTGEKKWESPLIELPSAAGMLATDGGLIFTGKADRRIRCARHRHRRDAVAVQDELERQFYRNHLYPQGSAVRVDRVGIGRRRHPALRRRPGSDRRLAVDVCVDAGMRERLAAYAGGEHALGIAALEGAHRARRGGGGTGDALPEVSDLCRRARCGRACA